MCVFNWLLEKSFYLKVHFLFPPLFSNCIHYGKRDLEKKLMKTSYMLLLWNGYFS